MLGLILAVALGTASVQIPLSGDPLPPSVTDGLTSVRGVARVEASGDALALEIAPDSAVRLRDLSRALARYTSKTRIDTDRLLIGRHTILEINAGRCFFCAEGPLGATLARMRFVKTWTVVDYVTKGRLRFRLEPHGEVPLSLLGGDTFEDILFTARYDEVERLDLYWPTGGVAWRPNEKTARSEATASRKPLLIFPTAGT
jgi:hypothetical protein